MNYYSGVKAAEYISQVWCLSASGTYSDKGCPKHQPGGGKGLVEKWPLGLGKSTYSH